MSRENVELVRRIYEAANQGDFGRMVADFAPEFEFIPSGALIPGLSGVQRGPEGYRRFVEEFTDEFDDPSADTHEFVEAGDRVLVSFTIRGRGKLSGAVTNWNVWQVWTVRDGSIVLGQGFTERDAALEAAGLSD